MSVEFYMNKTTGEITACHKTAVEWYRQGYVVGLYVGNIEKLQWVH